MTHSEKETASKAGRTSLALILCGILLLTAGSAVLIAIPKPEKMPELINENSEDALRTLEQLGAVVSIKWQGEERDAEEGAAGIVVSQSIENDELIFEGMEITLTIAERLPAENQDTQSAEPTHTPAPAVIPDEEQPEKGQDGSQYPQAGSRA